MRSRCSARIGAIWFSISSARGSCSLILISMACFTVLSRMGGNFGIALAGKTESMRPARRLHYRHETSGKSYGLYYF